VRQLEEAEVKLEEVEKEGVEIEKALKEDIIHHRVCNKSNMMAATRGAGTAYPFGAHEFTPGF
jgi:hypothetical protein